MKVNRMRRCRSDRARARNGRRPRLLQLLVGLDESVKAWGRWRTSTSVGPTSSRTSWKRSRARGTERDTHCGRGGPRQDQPDHPAACPPPASFSSSSRPKTAFRPPSRACWWWWNVTRAQSHRGVPRPASSARGHREPDRRRTQALQRRGAGSTPPGDASHGAGRRPSVFERPYFQATPGPTDRRRSSSDRCAHSAALAYWSRRPRRRRGAAGADVGYGPRRCARTQRGGAADDRP